MMKFCELMERLTGSTARRTPAIIALLVVWCSLIAGAAQANELQSLIDAAEPNGEVVLDARQYIIDAPVYLPSGITVRGAGVGQTKITSTAASGSLFRIEDGANNVTVSDLSLDGSGSGAAHGIVASKGSGHHLSNLEIKDLAGDGNTYGPIGIYFSVAVTDSVITNNVMNNIGAASEWGSGVRMENRSAGNRVEGNQITTTGRGGIFASNQSGDLVIRNNRVGDHGLATSNALGIEIQDWVDNTLIESNVVDHWISVDNSTRVAVRDNVVGQAVGKTEFAGLELAHSKDVIFEGNRVLGAAEIGLSLSGVHPISTARTLISDNEFRNAGSWGSQIQGDVGGIESLLMLNNAFADTVNGDGVRLNDNLKNLALVGNTITGNSGRGIDLIEVSSDGIDMLHLSGNTLAGNGDNQLPESDLASLPPLIFDGPSVVATGSAVSLSFHSPDGFVAEHAVWDLGYGLPVLGLNPEVTFATSGIHEITVLGIDQTGAIAYTTATIRAAPEPTTGLLLSAPLMILVNRRRSRAQDG